MKNLSNSQDERFETDRELSEGLADVFRLPVPAIQFDASTVARSSRLEVIEPKRRWRPALAAGAAVAGLALFLAGPSLFGGSPQEVSAQEVFQRTQAVAATNSPVANVQSYHMVATNEMFGPPGARAAVSNSRIETWYQDPQHQRSETYDESGRLVFGQSQDGDDLWFYSATDGLSTEGDGVLRVARTSGAHMGFTTFGAQDFGATNLNSLLESYSNACATAEKAGEETVAGRPTYVIEINATPETCEMKPEIIQSGEMTTVKVGGEGKGVAASVAGVAAGSIGTVNVTASGEGVNSEAGVPAMSFQIVSTTTRMWVDQETFITLKTETSTEDGPLFRYEVTEFELNPEFDASVFTYEAPEGVEVVEADGPQQIKVVLSGGAIVIGGEQIGTSTGGVPGNEGR